MSRTNWDAALKYTAPLSHFTDVHGIDRTDEVILHLTKAGGTIAISQGRLHMSEFSFKALLEKLNSLVESGKLPE